MMWVSLQDFYETNVGLQEIIRQTTTFSNPWNIHKWGGKLKTLMVVFLCWSNVMQINLTFSLWCFDDQAFWARATITIKRIKTERRNDDLIFSSTCSLLPLVGWVLPGSWNSSSTSDNNFSMSSITIAFVASKIHLWNVVAKSGSSLAPPRGLSWLTTGAKCERISSRI